MSKHRNSSNIKYIVIGVSVLVFILMLSLSYVYLFSNDNIDVGYFYDKDVGIVKGIVKEESFFKIFQQAVTFSPDSILIGNSVTLLDSHTIPNTATDQECIGIVQIQIKGPSIDWTTIKQTLCPTTPWQKGQTIETNVVYTPTSIGTWDARTNYFLSDCSAASCSALQPVVDQAINSVFVDDPITNCDNPIYSQWITHNQITGGRTENRTKTEYFNAPICAPSNSFEYRTFCNIGYHISGSSNGETGPANGQLTCQQDSNSTTILNCTLNACTGGLICDAITKLCKDPECNADVTTTCNNGINITTKDCNETTKLWIGNTNQTCLITSNNTNTNQTGSGITQCYKINTINDTKSCVSTTYTNTTTCPSAEYSNNTLCIEKIDTKDDGLGILGWTAIILGIFVLLGVIFLVIRFFKTK